MRSIAPNAAILVAAAMNAVIGVGAPWYTSGIHEWNGTAPTLNSTPTSSSAVPISASDVLPVPGGHRVGDAAEVQCAGVPVQHGNAVEEERR